MGYWWVHSTDAGAVFLYDLVLEFEDLSVAIVGSCVSSRIERTSSIANDYMLSSPSSVWMESVFFPTWSRETMGYGDQGKMIQLMAKCKNRV